MAIRVDPSGLEQLEDAVAAGTMSTGAYITEDGKMGSLGKDLPWAGRQEYIASEALRLAEIPAEEIRKIRPMQPIALFPDERMAYDRTPLTIAGALDPASWQPKVRSWVSGSTKPQERLSDQQEDVWSGTLRNASSSVNPMM